MVINKLYLTEAYSIKLADSVLIKLEDVIRKRDNVVVTIDASHYGFLNKNNTIYRHDTVRDCIPSFVTPNAKPIIQNHRPESSEKFGRIIAADYRETDFYKQFSGSHKIEDLSTKEYIDFCKNTLVPKGINDPRFNGLAFCQVVGKIDHETGVKKVLDSEFLHVSIGATPKRLICSECHQDQVTKMCDHYPKKGNGIFMLAEYLEYDELSFIERPADKFGKVICIHDGEEVEVVHENNILADIDIIAARDFFKLADGKKIVCMDNICKVINEPEEKMRKQKEGQNIFNVSYVDEFQTDQLKDIKISDSEDVVNEDVLKLSDEVMGEMTNRDFAIVQKVHDGIKRRFPIHNAENIKAATILINKAEDLTDSEKEKAITSISRAAKKAGIEFKVEDEDQKIDEKIEDSENKTEEENKPTSLDDAITVIKDAIQAIEFEEKEDGAVELKDADGQNPINEVFNMLVSFAGNLKWAGEALNNRVTDYLVCCGKEAHEKGMFDSLQDEVKTLKDSVAERDEDIAILEDQNMKLNFAMRTALVDEIVEAKTKLDLLQDADMEKEKEELMKLPYDVLIKQKKDFSKLASKATGKEVKEKEFKKIVDPTLSDEDEGGENQENEKLEDSDNTDVKPSEKEIVKAFINLFRMTGNY